MQSISLLQAPNSEREAEWTRCDMRVDKDVCMLRRDPSGLSTLQGKMLSSVPMPIHPAGA